MKKAIRHFWVICFFATISMAIGQTDKDELFDNLKGKYKNIKSVSLSFHRKGDNISGELKAKTGNKYHLSVKNRIFVCNGKTIWNYSSKDKSVVISDYEESNSPIKIEEIFFTFLNKYTPAELRTEQTSSGKSTYILLLKPVEVTETSKEIKLHIEKDNLNIIALESNNNGNWDLWEIDKLNTKKLSDKLFDFVPPDNTHITDLR
jgi:outer membrane lipoprotein-sorting protein